LVAAHFATLAGNPGSDRVVWRLDWKSVHRFFGLPELALLIQDLEGILGPDRPMTPWALFGRAADVKQFACMIEPPSLSPRIVAQSPCPGGRSVPRSTRPRERRRAAALPRPRWGRGRNKALLLLNLESLLLASSAGQLFPARESCLGPIRVPMGEQGLKTINRCPYGFQLDDVTRLPAGGHRTLGETDLPNTAVFESYKATIVRDLAYGQAQREHDPGAVPITTHGGGLRLGCGQPGREQDQRSD